MHPIDRDPRTGQLFALFAHATSSANLLNIRRNGFLRPDLEQALDVVIADVPALSKYRAIIASAVNGSVLGPAAREKDRTHVATWFANRAGLTMLQDEYHLVAPHGGEVYSVVFRTVLRCIEENGWGIALKPRYPNANVALLLIRMPLRFDGQELIPTVAGSLLQLEQKLMSGQTEYLKDLWEVQFVQSVPPDCIHWDGTVKQGLAEMGEELLSQAATKAIDRLR